MWSQLVLCALIGIAAASQNGWQNDMEYVYKVQGRTLTALHELGHEYSGIVTRSKIIIRPESEESLVGRFVDVQYSHVHANLPEGWNGVIPEEKLQYKSFENSKKPFQILMKNGIVRDIIVDSEVHNWEANAIKSVVSQLQLDVQGENLIESQINQLPEEHSNSATFKTMEDTITGTFETMYDISPLSEHILQYQPDLVPMPELQKDGEIIEIIKSKNFSNGEERPSYYYGFGNAGDFEPGTNQMKDFLSRSSASRVIVTGTLKRFTIQSSVTTNKIILRPTLNSAERGMVVSQVNLTLSEMKPASGSLERPQQGQKLGSLTYTYNTPLSGNYEARQGAQRKNLRNLYSSEERQYSARHPRSLRQFEDSVEENEEWAQEETKLNQAPQNPLLPMNVGYRGKSIKSSSKVNVIEAAQKLARQIAEEVKHPESIPEKQTLSKYLILTNVVRLMNEKELQQVVEKVYTKQEDGKTAWFVLYDAISHSGTGPALLIIQELIESNKLPVDDLTETFYIMSKSARYPTEEYMRAFYNLAIKQEEVKGNRNPRYSAILCFTDLVRMVYVDKVASHNQFPVHAFGRFHTEKGEEFVVEELIPHLKEKLEQSIRKADSQSILVYIRALGNVAHQRVLEVFKPYLEGEKQVSQFQRLQMVVALDNFVKVHPKVARSVLYKIYQNAADVPEVRVAAVCQLMRTSPPASMLQRMALYTNVDASEQVNSAVKSSIESAAQMETAEYRFFIENARSAQPLLTKKNYGIQFSQNYLRSYVEREMNLFYKQSAETIGSQDSFIPKALKYSLRAGLGGVKQKLVNVEAMVSSIDELTNVLRRQFSNKEETESASHKWASDLIAEKLNIKTDEREQLEANLLVQIFGCTPRYFAINNQTIELLPEILRDVENVLREGKDFRFTQFLNRYEMVISFPTEMAVPFYYSVDVPTMMHFEGKVRATSEPKMSNGETIRKPDTITAFAELRSVITTKLQTKLGFVTPHDNQEYVAGFDKNMQIDLPIKSQIEVDLKKQQMTAQIQPMEQNKETKVIHYSAWPYTARHDVLQLTPVSEGPHHKVIYTQNQPQTQFNRLVGKNLGMAFQFQYASEQKFADSMWLYQQFKRHDAITALLSPMHDESIHYTELNIKYVPQESTARKVQIRMGYESKYEKEEGQGSVEIDQLKNLPVDSKTRQQQLAKLVSTGIASSKAHVVDFEIEVDGENKIHYVATAAVASSQVSEKARLIVHGKKHGSKPYEFALTAKAHIPNTNGLDFLYALKFDPTTTVQAEVACGEDLSSASKMNVHAKLFKSESRKQYLKDLSESHRVQECNEEMKQGNHQLSNCANMTAEANLLDRINVNVEFQHISANVRNATNKLYNAIRYLGYFNLDENLVNVNNQEKEHQLTLKGRFEPDFEAVNITISSHKLQSHLYNVRVGQWAKRIFVSHPVFNMYTRTMGLASGYDTYRPICVVDKTATKTFDNKTYPADLPSDWTVMMQYVPHYAKWDKQYERQQQLEQYVVLVRDAKNADEKEVKMTIRTPETHGQVVEIDLQPLRQNRANEQQTAKVLVNGNEVKYNMKESYDMHHDLIKIYGLPNGEVKIVVSQAFYIIYDGERVKLTATHSKLRGEIRGLCGNFDGELANEFLAPENCVLQHPEEHIAAYQVEKTNQRQGRYNYKQTKGLCRKWQVKYVKVVSDLDMGRTQLNTHSSNQHWSHQEESTCMTHQTRYVVREDDSETCFTIRALPTCRKSCNAKGTIEKNVEVHCVKKSSVAQKWTEQIDNGASPDFGNKAVTASIKIRLPESCTKGL